MSKKIKTAMIGCTGHVGRIYIEKFLDSGFEPVILARTPEKVRKRFPGAKIIQGSMLSVEDVAACIKEAYSVLLITPIGGLNDSTIELKAARTLIRAARESGSQPHIIYISQLSTNPPSGVPLLDVKMDIEKELAQSGLPWSALRIGFYMGDVLQLKPSWIPKGLLFFPLDSRRTFSFSSEQDVAALAAHLIGQGKILNSSIDVIEKLPHSLPEIAQKAGEILRKRVIYSGSFPFLSIMKLARPILKRRDPVMFSKTFMLDYFNHHDYIGDSSVYDESFQNLDRTTMENYLKKLLLSDQ